MWTSITLIDSIIKQYWEDNSLNNKFLFDVFSISQVLKNKIIDNEDIYNSIIDNGWDWWIDSIILLVDDKYITSIEELKNFINKKEVTKNTELEIYFIQIKDSDSFKEKIFETMMTTFQDYFDNKLNAKSYNKELLSKFELIRECLDNFPIYTNKIKINILYISKWEENKISEWVKSKSLTLKRFFDDKIPTEVKINIIWRNTLRSLYLKQEENELILKYENDINSVFWWDDDKVAYIVQAKIKDFFNFIKGEDWKIREYMLENNVRHWQWNVEVNNNIYSTLENDKNIEFLWLNNWITIINDEVTPLPWKKLKLVNAQIVNWLQTSYSIFNFFSDNNSLLENEDRTILIKLIKSNDLKIIDKIIKSTNSQTAVRPADLKATDWLQRDIEEYFISEWYFYDRRKNFYKNLNKDRNKIFDIPKVAQYVETILFKSPWSARANPTSLVKDEDNYKKIFNWEIPLEVYLNSCIINKFVSNSILEIELDNISKKYWVSIRNFTFHLMLISTILQMWKYDYNSNDIKNINKNIWDSIFNDSLELLLKILDEYDNDPEKWIDNIVHTAKSKDFSNFLNEKLKVLKF